MHGRRAAGGSRPRLTLAVRRAESPRIRVLDGSSRTARPRVPQYEVIDGRAVLARADFAWPELR